MFHSFCQNWNFCSESGENISYNYLKIRHKKLIIFGLFFHFSRQSFLCNRIFDTKWGLTSSFDPKVSSFNVYSFILWLLAKYQDITWGLMLSLIQAKSSLDSSALPGLASRWVYNYPGMLSKRELHYFNTVLFWIRHMTSQIPV